MIVSQTIQKERPVAFTIVSKEQVKTKVAEKAIEAIHATIKEPKDWSEYNPVVKALRRHEDTFFFMGKSGEDLVGYVCIHKSGYLPFIAVMKSNQHKGLGVSLMQQAAKKCKEIGCKKLKLYCDEPVKNFYVNIQKLIGPLIKMKSVSSNKEGSYKIAYDLTKSQ